MPRCAWPTKCDGFPRYKAVKFLCCPSVAHMPTIGMIYGQHWKILRKEYFNINQDTKSAAKTFSNDERPDEVTF